MKFDIVDLQAVPLLHLHFTLWFQTLPLASHMSQPVGTIRGETRRSSAMSALNCFEVLGLATRKLVPPRL